MRIISILFSVLVASMTMAGQVLGAVSADPVNWPNSFKASNGVIWSDILFDKYANCISEKDARGKPIIGSDGLAVCKKDSNGNIQGASLVMIDSDAIRACAALGGELPSELDFDKLGAEIKKLNNALSESWTVDGGTSFGGKIVTYARTIGFDGNIVSRGYDLLGSLDSVRCIAK